MSSRSPSLVPGRAPAVIVVALGSLIEPEIGQPVRRLVHALRSSGRFSEVRAAFLEEQPSWQEAMATVAATDIVILPAFMFRGPWTGHVLPAALGLKGPVTRRGDRVLYLAPPLGTHPQMIDVVTQRAEQALERARHPATESVLVLARAAPHDHAEGAEDLDIQAQAMREKRIFRDVYALTYKADIDLKMYCQRLNAPQVVVIPYAMSNDPMTRQGLPLALGFGAGALAVEDVAVTMLGNQRLLYTSAVGADPAITQVAMARVDDALQRSEPALEATAEPWLDALSAARVERARGALLGMLRSQNKVILGDVLIRSLNGDDDAAAFQILHRADDGLAGLQRRRTLVDLEALVHRDPNKRYRPLRFRADLKRGWQYKAASASDLIDALEVLYPAGATLRFGALPAREWSTRVTQHHDPKARQRLRQLSERSLRRAAHACCGGLNCHRRPHWLAAPIDTGADAFPCPDACALMQAFADHVLVEEGDAEATASVADLGARGKRTVERALRNLRRESDAAVADFDDPSNIAWITYLLARYYGWQDEPAS